LGKRLSLSVCVALFALAGCGTPATKDQSILPPGKAEAATPQPAVLSAVAATATAAAATASPAPQTAAPTQAPATAAPATQAPVTRPPATAAPTAKPIGVVFTSVRSPVGRNGTGLAAVSTGPNISCSIVVTYKSGASTAQGLIPKTSDAAGAVSWTWNIGATTTLGTWPIDVTCGGARGHATFVVQ
jgi:hypothetical protein